MKFCFVLIFLCTSTYVFSQRTLLDSDDVLYTVVEEPPVFPAGGTTGFKKYIDDNLEYPKKEKRKHVEGKVYISFVIGKDGSISDVTCVKGITENLNQEGIRLINSSPPWRPGKMNGKAVIQRYVFPVEFKLPDKKQARG